MGIWCKLNVLIGLCSLWDELNIYNCYTSVSYSYNPFFFPFACFKFTLPYPIWRTLESIHPASFLQQLLKWTCRRPWVRPRRPAPRNVWSSAILTAAGCPRRWPSSKRLLLPHCPRSAFSRAGHAAAPCQTGVTPSADLYPEMIWTKGAIGPSSTAHWTDTVTRKRTLWRSSLWPASLPHRARRTRVLAPPLHSYMSISCKARCRRFQ